MKEYIADFTNHLSHAINIGESSKFISSEKKITSVLVCGLGGSGIGGTIVGDITLKNSSVPIYCCKGYSVPNYVNKSTLVIVCSYSGNTEETLAALKTCQDKKAEITIITSGGKLKSIAENQSYNVIVLPANHPPRAMFGYGFTAIFYALYHYGIANISFKTDIEKSIILLNKKKTEIQNKAKFLAEKIYNNTAVIYAPNDFEGVATRFRQQINENSKMLCWHHVIPEMNHNELLGWRTNVNNLAVIFLRNNSDFNRTQIRTEISKKIISKYTDNINEFFSEGDSIIENSLYHVHFGDWVSWYLSEKNKVDAIEIDVINFLKQELSKIK